MNSAALGLAGFAVQILALCLFSCGFFEFRASSGNKSTADPCITLVDHQPIYDRLVFVLIDALRSDFVYGDDSKFSFIRSMIRNTPENTMSFIARARPPTVTMPRLKALTAGSPPIFLDLILNFDETGIASSGDASDGSCGASGFTQDTWIKGLKGNGKKIVFYGDDTWVRLFPGCFDEQHAVSSFFVQDYTHVDNQVTERAVPRLEDSDWDAMILHYLGLDHIGHIDGAFSKLMGPKQMEMDKMIELIFRKLELKDATEGRSSLLVVLGDHGMADNGNHGGSSEPEVNTAAIVFSPSKEFEVQPVRSVVNQVDFVPTIAGLFGLPVPHSNTGVFIQSLIPKNVPADGRKLMLQKNVCQLAHHLGQSSPPCEGVEQLSSVLTELGSKVAGQTGDYNLSYMISAVVITALCILLAIYRTSHFERQGRWETLFVLAYIILQSSSSFIEEEHEFWYFALSSLVALRVFISGGSTWSAVATTILARVPRYWNATGYQRAQDVDARSWLPSSSISTLLILLAVLGLLSFKYRKSECSGVFLLASAVVFSFKSIQTGWWVPAHVPKKEAEILMARCCYIMIGGLSALHLLKGVGIRKARFILALLFVFLLKIHNALIVGVLALIGDILESFATTDSFIDDSIILSFMHYSYFALGPSNLLVSLDFSNAYIGLTHFNMALISTITFLMTWSGPIMAAIIFVGSPSRKARCLISDLSLWRSFVALGLLINLTVQRNHLFIWTVFAPRLLFEFGWTIFYTLLLAFCLINSK